MSLTLSSLSHRYINKQVLPSHPETTQKSTQVYKSRKNEIKKKRQNVQEFQ